MSERLFDALIFLGVGIFCIVRDLNWPTVWSPWPLIYGIFLILVSYVLWRKPQWARWPNALAWLSMSAAVGYLTASGNVNIAIGTIVTLCCLYYACRIAFAPAPEESFKSPLAAATEAEPDRDLCGRTFDGICQFHGEPLNLSNLRVEERNVVVVESARGLIGNGGFNYLFEGDFSADDYRWMAQAFETIGAASAAQAFRRALALFPGSQPPADREERLELYRKGDGAMRHEIDTSFWDADREITHCLAAHIRSRPGAFAHLAVPAAAGDAKRAGKTDSEPRTPSGPSLADLPHWARVAFVARCARRLLPVFRANWPNATNSRQDAILRAIALAEQSAAEARPAAGLANARLNAVVTAGAALTTLYGFPNEDNEPMPPDGNMAVAASSVAKVGEHAALAAEKPAEGSTEAALAAYGFALEATSKHQDILEALQNDLFRLYGQALQENWTDETPVPSNVWTRTQGDLH